MAERVAPSRVFPTKSLYELSVIAVADKFITFKKHLFYLPEKVVFDLYYQVSVKTFLQKHLQVDVFIIYTHHMCFIFI